MSIELRLLRSFVAVAEEGNVGRAAARLYVSQPALSQQIRGLEEQVGVPLFVRHPRGVTLTEAGAALLAEARAVLGQSDRLEAAVEGLRRGDAARLALGVPPGLPGELLPPTLQAFRAALPDVRVEVVERTTPEQVGALLDRTLDVGIVREPVASERLGVRTLLSEPLGASLPACHPLAARPAVALRDLQHELFVCFPRAWAPSLHDVLVEELRVREIEARFQDATHVGTTQTMVAAGQGVTLSARPWLEGTPGVVWRPLADVDITIRTAAAWHLDDRSPVVRAFLDLLPDEVEAAGRVPG